MRLRLFVWIPPAFWLGFKGAPPVWVPVRILKTRETEPPIFEEPLRCHPCAFEVPSAARSLTLRRRSDFFFFLFPLASAGWKLFSRKKQPSCEVVFFRDPSPPRKTKGKGGYSVGFPFKSTTQGVPGDPQRKQTFV